MNLIGRIFDFIVYGPRSKLRDYEAFCFQALFDAFDEVDRVILKEQIEKINAVQRFSNDKLVTIHFVENRPGQDFPLFARTDPELVAASVKLGSPNNARKEIKCDLTVHRGRISSLTFSKSPASLSVPLELKQVTVFVDLSVASFEPEAVPARTPMLDKIKDSGELKNVLPPAQSTAIRSISTKYACTFPGDYLALIAESDGFTVGSWEFYGTNLRKLVWPESTYIIGAESDELAIGFLEGGTHPDVILINGIDDTAEVRGSEFVTVLIQYARESSEGETESS